MPCSDSTPQVVVILDRDERLSDLRFSKITCGRGIGNGQDHVALFRGKSIDELRTLGLDDLLRRSGASSDEERFFLFLAWDSVRHAISCYRGEDERDDDERYRIASIDHDGEKTSIRMGVKTPKELAKILPCSIMDRQSHAHPTSTVGS